MTSRSADKILIIDDDTIILDFLIDLLADELSVSYGSDSTKAVELTKQHKPDLILLDVMMPLMDGYEVCRLLKADPDTQHVPIVFMTAKSDSDDIARGLELGAIDYITKPFDPESTAAKIRNFLAQITDTRAIAQPVQQESIPEEQRQERRAEGEHRTERRAEAAPDGSIERRALGAARADRYAKPVQVSEQGMTLKTFFMVGVLIAVIGGGGYALYGIIPANNPQTLDKSQDLSEEEIPAHISEADDQAPTSTPAPTGQSSPQRCDELPKVEWWGNASHDSIISYVNNKAAGDWLAYIAKWQGQHDKLASIYAKDGAVIAPKLGTRLSGPDLQKYINQINARIQITKCLAKINEGK